MLKSVGKALASHHVSSCRIRLTTPCVIPSVYNNQIHTSRIRQGTYFKSRTEESPDQYTDYEKSFDEWKFVEKLIPPTHVPAPPADPNVVLPSGWRPPSPPKECIYHVRRSKNHMLPVYLKIMDRGLVRYTYITKVEGNIWQLEKDIGEYLQTEVRVNYPVITRTNEISRHVIIKGELVEPVKEWLLAKGF